MILAILAVTLLAKHGRGRRNGRYTLRPVRIAQAITLGALANVTVISQGLTGNADAAYRCISLTTLWTLKNAATNQKPVHVGYAHSDYTVTEIKEFIEGGSAISIGNKVSNEQANRLIRLVGTFGMATEVDSSLNDGKPIKTRLNWALPIGKEVVAFAYNDSGASLTTGSIVDMTGTMWVKDAV